MKFVKWILVPLVVLFLVVFGVYQFGKDYAVDKLTEELESSGKMEEIKERLKNDPEIDRLMKEFEKSPEGQQLLAEAKEMAKSIAEDSNVTAAVRDELPFHTKEEAIEVVVDRVSAPKLVNLYNEFKKGTITKEEIIAEVGKEFTEEEMTALKLIAYEELYMN